jgi:glycosyltransferase involved in cell wall biosynthesis
VERYFLTGGRLVPYKRFDLAVEAFNRLGLPLKIFGTGPALKSLQAMAKPNIEFLGRVPDEQMNELYGRATAFLNPQEEDFGITVVEAMAAGRPVIAYAAGGALETVKPGESGVLFQDQEWESLADAVIRFKPEQFPPAAIRAWAESFGVERFKREMHGYLDRTWQRYQSGLH